MSKKLVLVTTAITYKMQYVIECDDESHALDEVVCSSTHDDFKEFHQEFISENIFDSKEITKEEYLKMINSKGFDNWSDDFKLSLINKIDYKNI